MRRLISGLLITCAWAGSAFAASVDEAQALFLAGDYDQAIEMAEALGTPEGLALAAETLSAKVMLGYVENANKSAKKARKWAESALEEAPDLQQAQLQYALARGFETRTSSPFKAWRKKLPRKTLKAITVYRDQYPDDPRGDALLGAWHLGIIRKTGDKNGKSWYDATEVDGMKFYEGAMQAAPKDIVIASNYAVTILALDTERFKDRAFEVLTQVEKTIPKNAVEKDTQDLMMGLLPYFDDLETLNDKVIHLVDG